MAESNPAISSPMLSMLHLAAGDRAEVIQSHGGQLLRRGRTVCRKCVQHFHHFDVASDHPGMKKRIPNDRIVFAQSTIERIRVGQHLGIEQAVEAGLAVRSGRRRCGESVGSH